MKAHSKQIGKVTSAALLGLVLLSACGVLRSCGPDGGALTPGMQTQNAILTQVVGSIGTQMAVVPALATAGTSLSDHAVQTAVFTSLPTDNPYLPTVIYLLTQTPIRFPTATFTPTPTIRPAPTATRTPTRAPAPTDTPIAAATGLPVSQTATSQPAVTTATTTTPQQPTDTAETEPPTATQPAGSPQPTDTPAGVGPFPTNTPAGSLTPTNDGTAAGGASPTDTAGATPSPASAVPDSTITPNRQ